ncbi:hypothetical protein [Ostreibacterium oceani]|uniref:Uncharacterized protein n=1 Tax=Ostreibacterium oceani TaxID=2654998 RepID=A0A6N7EZC8_9GAMM|nr:hypothetical protein [Ostreibacterium oceani]MPV86910.1 hypothetical protein [Ostreibacterium oceani]
MPDILTLDAVNREAQTTRTAVDATLKTTDPRIDAMATSAGLTSVASAINANVATRASSTALADVAADVTTLGAQTAALAASATPPSGGAVEKIFWLSYINGATKLSVSGSGVIRLLSIVTTAVKAGFALRIDGNTIYAVTNGDLRLEQGVGGLNLAGGGIAFNTSFELDSIKGETSAYVYAQIAYTLNGGA